MGFQQGLSGLNASSKNLDVIGNNIANASTAGFKASRAEFGDVYAAALNGAGVNNIGIGVGLAAVAQQFTQGNITTTENPMDLAINGQGFFQVSDGVNPRLYSRNGQFKVDREGFIVNNDGLKLLGYPADGTGVIQPGISQVLQLPTAGIEPATTKNIKLEFNVDSRVKTTSPLGTTGIILNDPSTYNNATSLSVYDAKGQEIALTLYYQKGEVNPATGETPWHVYATANGTPLAVDSAGNGIGVDANNNPQTPWTTLIFPRTGGAPLQPSGLTNPPNGLLNMDIPVSTNAVGAQALDIVGIQVNLLGASENGSPFAVTDVLQDGYAPGQLSGILIEGNGIVTARYSNGQTKPAGQIELANFRNPQGLQPLGGNVWASTFASGDPVLGVPAVGNFGQLQSGALEDSNTDLTIELVNMITAQRVYQANAQTIRTQDQVLQTITNLR
ncbi:flagellar hook protein FlgE [Inhella inkyongensis]|uniref:Flagellar hook protein FlgE n=1 Tax=Inhella inkyongensis TaxID=392593 RepID=A0A840SC65_9BURK|nr:flagellar hook protein FlgE [Inhella inkyongensis]MBB5205940.1 flagellar hook protein FlgE [Inhella inkyongensis]